MSNGYVEMLQPRRMMAVVSRGSFGDAIYEVTDKGKLIVTLTHADTIGIVTRSKGNGLSPTIYVGSDPTRLEQKKQLTGIRSVQIFGSSGNDRVTFAGPSRDTTVFLGDGEDYFQGSTEMLGTNEVHGGGGDDQIRGDFVAPSGTDTRRWMRFYGDDGDDRLYSDRADDLLVGGKGNDLLKAYAGRDTLEGGDGKDTLDGGTGIDKMNGGASVDRIDYRANDKVSADKRDHLKLLELVGG